MRELTESFMARVIDGIPRASLVAFFSGLQGLGASLLDRSGNGYHGTISGASWVKLPDVDLYVPKYDGTNDLISANDVTTGDIFNGAFTIIAWAKLTAWANNRDIVSAGNAVAGAGRHFVSITFATGTKKFGALTNVGEVYNTVTSLLTYNNNSSWHFFALTVDADSHINHFIIDAVDQGNNSTNTRALVCDKFYIGQLVYSSANVDPWIGNTGMVIVCSEELSTTELERIRTRTKWLYRG